MINDEFETFVENMNNFGLANAQQIVRDCAQLRNMIGAEMSMIHSLLGRLNIEEELSSDLGEAYWRFHDRYYDLLPRCEKMEATTISVAGQISFKMIIPRLRKPRWAEDGKWRER